MNDNDILKYVKHNFEDIKDDVLFLANPENITRSSLTRLFSNQGTKQDPVTKEISIVPAKYKCTDYFDLPANILPNQTEPIKDTTFGIFIFNSFILCQAFGGKLAYINIAITDKKLETLESNIAKLIIDKKITIDEFGTFCNTLVWLGYQTELFMPGISLNLIIPNDDVMKMKKQLFKEHPELIEHKTVNSVAVGEYHDKIEVPLLKEAEKIRENDYSGRLYDLDKPSFSNNYKNNNITNGPLPDPSTGGYKINENSFNEGVNAWNFDILANKSMIASYSRGVNTQIGGTYAKYVGIMMQTVVAGEKGSDCGTKGYLDFRVTKENKKSIEFDYALINGKEIELTMDILNQLVGKTIKIRSPLFCKDKRYLCNKCLGNRSYYLGLKNIGLSGNIPLDAEKNKSMKKMHNMAIKTVQININDYINVEY